MRAVVVGSGAVGGRAARHLLSLLTLDELVVVDPDVQRREAVVDSLGISARGADDVAGELQPGDLALVAAPVDQRRLAEHALEAGAHVVSSSDVLADVKALLDLDAEARERGRHVVIGAAFSPGLTCVLAIHAATRFDHVEEVHVARLGAGGPACARQHHHALTGQSVDWREGAWVRRRGGSGRELCWFPDPVRAVDCYRAASPEALVLTPAFPGVRRVTVRVAANRRDRLTARLPMLRRPHPEGELGAVRVEVRGQRGSARDDCVLGAVDRPAVAAGTVAALAGAWALQGRLARSGAAGLAELVEPVPFLAALAERGVKAAAFEGAAREASV